MRGQAAFEFLSTYGFAILVVLVSMSALAYFGVVDPQKYFPDTYEMNPEFSYVSHVFYTRNAGPEFVVALQNNLAKPIFIEKTAPTAMCHDCKKDPDIWVDCSYRYDEDLNDLGCAAEGFTVHPGDTFRIGCEPGNSEPNNRITFDGVGERHKVSFSFRYREVGNTYFHPFEGTITAYVGEP